MQQTATDKLWTGDFVKIILVNLFIFISFHSVLPAFPYFVKSLGYGTEIAGLAAMLFSFTSIASRPFIGHAIDTRSRFVVLFAGLIGLVLIPFGYIISASIVLILIFRAINGILLASASTASSTIVTDIVPKKHLGKGLGMFGLSTAISTAIAPALGLAIMKHYGFMAMFAFAACVAVIGLIIAFSTPRRSPELERKPFKISGIFEKNSVPASLMLFFYMLVFGVIETFIALFATENNLPGGGLYFMIMAAAMVATRLTTGGLVDRYGEKPMIYACNGAMTLALLILGLFPTPALYLLTAVLVGFGFGAMHPAMNAMAMRVIPPARRGAASSTFLCAFDLGMGIGSLGAGILIKDFGYSATFLIMIAGCIACTAYYALYARKHASAFKKSE